MNLGSEVYSLALKVVSEKMNSMMKSSTLEEVMSYWYIQNESKGEEAGIRTLISWLF